MTPAKDIVAELAVELPRFLTTNEAADLLRITRRHVYRLVDSGELTKFQHKPGGPLRIPRQRVLDYIEERL